MFRPVSRSTTNAMSYAPAVARPRSPRECVQAEVEVSSKFFKDKDRGKLLTRKTKNATASGNHPAPACVGESRRILWHAKRLRQ